MPTEAKPRVRHSFSDYARTPAEAYLHGWEIQLIFSQHTFSEVVQELPAANHTCKLPALAIFTSITSCLLVLTISGKYFLAPHGCWDITLLLNNFETFVFCQTQLKLFCKQSCPWRKTRNDTLFNSVQAEIFLGILQKL